MFREPDHLADFVQSISNGACPNPMRTGLIIRIPAMLLLLAFAGCSARRLDAQEPERVEYSLRWKPGIGGPRSVDEVARTLDMPFKETAGFRVEYARGTCRDGATCPVLRKRVANDGDVEFCLKWRSESPFPRIDMCPEGTKTNYEKDVSFVGADSARSVYSVSCVGDSAALRSEAVFPARSASFMTRFESKDARLEIWILPAGDTLFEVSHKAKNTNKSRIKFRSLVDNLIARGAKPVTESKEGLNRL